MDETARRVAEEVTRASDEERISFPDVVQALMAAGVERYHADLPHGRRTYSMPDGSAQTVAGHALSGPVAERFSADAVAAAVRAVQKGEIQYREFCDRIAAAGCPGYHVFIAGRRVVYYGRDGGLHVEHFPGAK